MNRLVSYIPFVKFLTKSFLNNICGLPHFIKKEGWWAFQLGLFFLPSSAFLAGCCLLPALSFTTSKRFNIYWNDGWNKPFFLITILMLLGIFNAYTGWLAVVGLGNWLPFFWLFMSAQPYLMTGEARRRIAICIVAGTFPVFLTGFGQLWFEWEGPWSLFGGLIQWFLAPGGEPAGRLSGLFDYANIAGAWFALVFPFALAIFLQLRITPIKRIFAFLFLIAIACGAVLTNSRNAWGGLFLSVPFVLGPMSWYWLLPLLGALLIPVILASLSVFPIHWQSWARQIVPEGIWSRLSDIQYGDTRSLASTRLGQWKIAIQFISERPLFGWGAAAFSVLYPLRTGLWHGHAHNLPLDLAVSHGLAVAFVLVGTVIGLLITALKRGVLLGGVPSSLDLNERIIDRAWWTSIFVLLVMHGSDMPFFDSRINIVGWILLSGLRCMLKNNPTKTIN